jgi:hypothetical protein
MSGVQSPHVSTQLEANFRVLLQSQTQARCLLLPACHSSQRAPAHALFQKHCSALLATCIRLTGSTRWDGAARTIRRRPGPHVQCRCSLKMLISGLYMRVEAFQSNPVDTHCLALCTQYTLENSRISSASGALETMHSTAQRCSESRLALAVHELAWIGFMKSGNAGLLQC